MLQPVLRSFLYGPSKLVLQSTRFQLRSSVNSGLRRHPVYLPSRVVGFRLATVGVHITRPVTPDGPADPTKNPRPPRRRKIIFWIVLILSVVICGVTWYISSFMVHPPWLRRRRPNTDDFLPDLSKTRKGKNVLMGKFTDPLEDWGFSYAPIEFQTSDVVTIRGWFVPSSPERSTSTTADERHFINSIRARNSDICIITVHGGGNDRRDFLRFLPLFAREGFPVVMFDCRNHGSSDGRGGISLGLKEHLDVLAAVKYAKEVLKMPRIVVFGTSQGAVSALLAAAVDNKTDHRIDCVIAENPFSSPRDALREAVNLTLNGQGFRHRAIEDSLLYKLFKHVNHWVPDVVVDSIVSLALFRMGYNESTPVSSALQAVQSFKMPLLLMHGTSDTAIPASHSEALFAAAHAHPKYLYLQDSDHMVLYNRSPDEYKEVVESFLLQLQMSDYAGRTAAMADAARD